MNRNLKIQTERAGGLGEGELPQSSQQECPKAAWPVFRVRQEASRASAAAAGSRVGGDWVVGGGGRPPVFCTPCAPHRPIKTGVAWALS